VPELTAAIPYALAILIGGIACGFINTLASSGSAISLPLLLFIGLPEIAANATNRLSVSFGSLMALRTFHAEGKLEWRAAGKMVPPATLGSIVGGYLGARMSARAQARVWVFRTLVAVILLELVHLGVHYFKPFV
jgi:uncharacterized protein